jgi:hypothetical protein
MRERPLWVPTTDLVTHVAKPIRHNVSDIASRIRHCRRKPTVDPHDRSPNTRTPVIERPIHRLLRAKAAPVFNTSNAPVDREAAVSGDALERLWKDCVFG